MPGPEHAFLHQQDPNLQASDAMGTEGVDYVVRHLRQEGERIADKPPHRIEAYLGFLADRANDGILTGDPESIQYQVAALSVALTPKNAQAYTEFQMKVMRQQGRGGDINIEKMTDEERMDKLRVVHIDQERQLTQWAQELNSSETNYPDWFKYWAFKSVSQLKPNPQADPNQPKQMFKPRDEATFALFPELDRASLALVYSAVREKLGIEEMPNIGNEYKAMRELLPNARFGELYGEAQNHGFVIDDELKAVTTGQWSDYARTSDRATSKEVSARVGAYRTGWCTAGTETAHNQLSKGDFYIWSSDNPDPDKPPVPRIAVRMENGVVAEVRGILPGQELEDELMDTAFERIQTLPGGESYFQKIADMKRIAAIEKRMKSDPQAELNDEDVVFLYELNREIQGFGYNKDPRIVELRAKRGERSVEEVARALPEAIRQQLTVAAESYKSVAKNLAAAREQVVDDDKFARLFEAKNVEWNANGTYAYVAQQIAHNGGRFVLVAAPNVVAGLDEFATLDQKYEASLPPDERRLRYPYEGFERGYYSGEELSGARGESDVRFSLVPVQSTTEFTNKTAVEQAAILDQMQAEHPGLRLEVPSPLDAVTYWFTLLNHGISTGGVRDNTDAKTMIRHFDLPPRETVEGRIVTPFTALDNRGLPILRFTSIDLAELFDEREFYTRIALG